MWLARKIESSQWRRWWRVVWRGTLSLLTYSLSPSQCISSSPSTPALSGLPPSTLLVQFRVNAKTSLCLQLLSSKLLCSENEKREKFCFEDCLIVGLLQKIALFCVCWMLDALDIFYQVFRVNSRLVDFGRHLLEDPNCCGGSVGSVCCFVLWVCGYEFDPVTTVGSFCKEWGKIHKYPFRCRLEVVKPWACHVGAYYVANRSKSPFYLEKCVISWIPKCRTLAALNVGRIGR